MKDATYTVRCRLMPLDFWSFAMMSSFSTDRLLAEVALSCSTGSLSGEGHHACFR